MTRLDNNTNHMIRLDFMFYSILHSLSSLPLSFLVPLLLSLLLAFLSLSKYIWMYACMHVLWQLGPRQFENMIRKQMRHMAFSKLALTTLDRHLIPSWTASAVMLYAPWAVFVRRAKALDASEHSWWTASRTCVCQIRMPVYSYSASVFSPSVEKDTNRSEVMIILRPPLRRLQVGA